MTPEATLFPLPEPQEVPPTPPTRREEARVLRPVRTQLEWIERSLDATLPLDHHARGIWEALERLDLAAFYATIKATTHRPGRPTADPQLLLGLWLLAVVEGVGSARHLARLCEEHDAFRWMCGGVPINYHLLSDCRGSQGVGLEEVLTQIVASLLAAGVVTLRRVAQDGMRVRADAGAGSFRRRERLEACLAEAEAEVKRLAEEREHPDPGVSQRERAARERAAEERKARVREALRVLPEVQAAKARQRQTLATAKREQVTEPRVSTTDPQARVMKMPDGGYRPAYNVELATETEGGVIVGVAVTSEGTDARQAVPMVEQVERRTGRRPAEYLMDGGFAAREAITTLERRGVTVYAPPPKPRRRAEGTQYQPHEGDTAEVIQWRERMATEEAKTIYRQRAATAEWSNAQVRQHGLGRLWVRGLAKVTAVALLVAVAHNIVRWGALL